MDLYGSWDAVTGSSSGSSTPVKPTAQAQAGAEETTPEASTQDGRSSKSPTIEQELEQMGTFVSGMSKNLGSYWGQFRRQSATALKQSQQYATNAAKDITPLLDKAKAELDKISEQAKASAAAGQAASTSGGPINPDAPSIALSASAQSNEEDASTSSSVDKDISSSASETDTHVSATAFFSRLQSQLSTNPNFQSFQHNFTNIQNELKSKVDFSKVDLAEASKRYEQAMNSGEKYFKVAGKELSDLFGEAVRIVPPEQATGGHSMFGDGDDDEDERGLGGSASGTGKLQGRLADKRKKAAAVAAAGRKESLLHRIRSDPAVLLVDPAQPPSMGISEGSSESAQASSEGMSGHADTREAFARYCAKTEKEYEGGMDGEAWKNKIQSELEDGESGQVLKATYESIVPSKLSAEAFWSRYFFRVQQIEEDEARRKEILEGATQQDEDDFSWDMEDESVSSAAGDVDPLDKGKGREGVESTTNTTSSDEPASQGTPKLGSKSSATALQKDAEATASSEIDDSWGGEEGDASTTADSASQPVAAPPKAAADETKSSRNSSEEGTTSSYDMVSATSGSPKLEKKESNATLGATATPAVTQKKAGEDEEDEDSDWE